MTFRYALFDLDGTISASAPGITRSVQYALAAVGIDEPDLHNLESFVGPPLNVEFERRYHLDPETTEFAVSKYREYYTQQKAIFDCSMYPGTRQMLSACKNNGIRLAIASSKPQPFVIQILENFGILHYFDIVVGSMMHEEKGKAGKDQKTMLVRKALDQLRSPGGTDSADEDRFRKGCAMIGDRSFDMIGAKENHVFALGVSFGYGSEEELLSAGADRIAHSVKELEQILTGQL